MDTIRAEELIRAANKAMLDAIATTETAMAASAAACEPVLKRIAIHEELEAAGYRPIDQRHNLIPWEPPKTIPPNEK